MCIRDSYGSACLERSLTWMGPIFSQPDTRSLWSAADRLGEVTTPVLWPVSYTHLDVYKRQVLNLKSRLTQLLALSSAIDWGNVGTARVICKNPEDETDVFRMNLYGDK